MQYLANGALIHLECFTTRQNLRIKDDGRIDGNGGVGAPATFMVHNTGNGKIKFQTQGASGKFIGIMPTGQIMSVFNSKEAELVVVPSSTGGDMIFIANNWPAGFYVGVNPMGNPVMCNNMSVGQFGAFTVKPSGKVMSPGAAAAGMAVGMAAGMVNAVAGAMGMGVTVSTQPSYPPPPPPQHHHMPPPQHQHYQPPPPMHGNCHVVVTPPAPRYGRDYSKAKLLVAKYGDFASKRLVDATRRLSSCIDRQGNLTIGPNYNGVFSDPAPGVLKALLLVWVINDKFNDRDIHWGILKENETQVAELDSISFGHPVTQFPAGIYGDFASGRYTDIRPVFAREFRFMTLNCSSYNQLFGDPAPGVRKALIVFYDSPCYKYMNISGENDIKTFSANDKSNEVIFDAFRH